MDVMLPSGGCVMALAEMYFDESEDKTQKLLCVAGYLFTKEKCVALSEEWSAVLARERLPFFRMVDCAHGTGVFKGFNVKRRIAIQTELMTLLVRYMEVGFAISFDLRFEHLCPSAMTHGIKVVYPYSLCAWFSLAQGKTWADKNGFDGEVAYFFEAGQQHEKQANHIMNTVFKRAELRSFYKYAGHAFLPKEAAIPLQCGDILAWQWLKQIKNEREHRARRADLNALLSGPHFVAHFNEEKLFALRTTIQNANREEEIKELLASLPRGPAA
jgi:hypothetical protein